MSLDRDDIACEADNIAQMLWGAESLMAEVSTLDERGVRRLDVIAAISTMRGARLLLEKLAEDVSKLPA